MEGEGEAIVGEIDGAERLARDGFEGMVQVGGPVANVGLAVVGLGEDVGDPDRDEPAVGESLMERMCREMAIEDLGEAQLDKEAEQQRDIVDAFMSELQGCIHSRAPSMARGPGCNAEAENHEDQRDSMSTWAGQEIQRMI